MARPWRPCSGTRDAEVGGKTFNQLANWLVDDYGSRLSPRERTRYRAMPWKERYREAIGAARADVQTVLGDTPSVRGVAVQDGPDA